MTAYSSCDFEGCEEEATAELRFELTEPRASAQTMGIFRLHVCRGHTREEFMPAQIERPSARALATPKTSGPPDVAATQLPTRG